MTSNWLVIVGAKVVLETAVEPIARAKAEELAIAGESVCLAQQVASCAPAPSQPKWTP